MKEEEIIELAESKGFKQVNIVTVNNRYYLILCTLQKWLRDEYDINIYVDSKINEDMYIIYVYITNIRTMELLRAFKSPDYNTYEQALEQGLIEGLKLIP